jgi:acetate kinase
MRGGDSRTMLALNSGSSSLKVGLYRVGLSRTEVWEIGSGKGPSPLITRKVALNQSLRSILGTG